MTLPSPYCIFPVMSVPMTTLGNSHVSFEVRGSSSWLARDVSVSPLVPGPRRGPITSPLFAETASGTPMTLPGRGWDPLSLGTARPGPDPLGTVAGWERDPRPSRPT